MCVFYMYVCLEVDLCFPYFSKDKVVREEDGPDIAFEKPYGKCNMRSIVCISTSLYSPQQTCNNRPSPRIPPLDNPFY